MPRLPAYLRSAGSGKQMPSSPSRIPAMAAMPSAIGGLTMQQLADRTLAHARAGPLEGN